MPKITPKTLFIWLAALVLFGYGSLGYAADAGRSRWEPAISSTPEPPAELSRAVIEVAKNQIPAVVHIQVTEHQEMQNPLLPLEQNPFLQQFFNLPKNMPKKLQRQMVGIGSGMLIDENGHILTNHHVVGGASQIMVTLSDGSQFKASVVGSDPLSDLAVIKISRQRPFPYVTFGDSDQVQVGQWVVAIGQPEGLEESVTQGIISAEHRTGITSPTNYQDFLQTDAPINPGNSGGPLLTLSGRVIGINAVILSASGGSMGIGFAVPSKMAIHVAKQLIEEGKVVRGWLGVAVRDVTPAIAKSRNITPPHGALVAEVETGGPADRAGIRKGDIILKYRGEQVSGASSLRNIVANTRPGTAADLTIQRDGQQMKRTADIGNLENRPQPTAGQKREP